MLGVFLSKHSVATGQARCHGTVVLALCWLVQAGVGYPGGQGSEAKCQSSVTVSEETRYTLFLANAG